MSLGLLAPGSAYDRQLCSNHVVDEFTNEPAEPGIIRIPPGHDETLPAGRARGDNQPRYHLVMWSDPSDVAVRPR